MCDDCSKDKEKMERRAEMLRTLESGSEGAKHVREWDMRATRKSKVSTNEHKWDVSRVCDPVRRLKRRTSWWEDLQPLC
jgi:hypothetical protein